MKILNEYAGRPIEDVPQEYRVIIARLIKLGQKGTTSKDSKILNKMRQAVIEHIASNDDVRQELEERASEKSTFEDGVEYK